MRHARVDAPWVLDGPVNGEAFRVHVKQVLAPTLKPGDVVVMDNLGSHKVKEVREAVRNAGARMLFLPPYSPDVNLVEQAFSKMKHRMRKARSRCRETLWRNVGDILETFKPGECVNYFVNAGYAAT